MDMEEWNQMHVRLMREYIRETTGLEYDQMSLNERNRLCMEWIQKHAESLRHNLWRRASGAK